MRFVTNGAQDTGHASLVTALPQSRCQAIAAAARVLAIARAGRDELYTWGGAAAVAEAAYVPGGPSRDEIAATYERLRRQAGADAEETASRELGQ
jgi:histidinol dehydrogenase